jgi:hypothetical protein
MGQFPVCKANEALIKQSNIIRRLVVKFKLKSKDDFWGKDFPRFSETALLPEDDHLLLRFYNEFGPESRSFSLYKRAQVLAE